VKTYIVLGVFKKKTALYSLLPFILFVPKMTQYDMYKTMVGRIRERLMPANLGSVHPYGKLQNDRLGTAQRNLMDLLNINPAEQMSNDLPTLGKSVLSTEFQRRIVGDQADLPNQLHNFIGFPCQPELDREYIQFQYPDGQRTRTLLSTMKLMCENVPLEGEVMLFRKNLSFLQFA